MLRHFLSRNVERLILFLGGVLLSAVASGLIEEIISQSTGLLVAAAVVVSIAALFFFAEVTGRVQNLADTMETTVRYLEEPFRDQEGVPYRGRIFSEIARLVAEAKTEILVISTPITGQERPHKTALHPTRERYLTTIEENIRRHRTGKFRYVRVLQIPVENDRLPIVKYYGQTTSNHCRRILEIARKEESPDLELHILWNKTRQMTSFMVIDQRLLILEVNGYDPEGATYMVGAFFIEDRGSKLVEKFARYFRNAERQAESLSLSGFEDSLQKEAA